MLVTTAWAQPNKEAEGWSASVGGGAFWGPAFSGSSDYQLMLVPSIRLNYNDTFFASVEQGMGYNFAVNSDWVAGPLIKFDFGRKADGKSPFRVAGKKSTALKGFRDIDSTMMAGGFARYNRDSWSAKIELLQGLSSHEGMVADLSIDYKARFGGSEAQPGPPVFIATGPRFRWANENYNNAYYGITTADSLATGLPAYTAGGGVTSIGWGLALVMPLTREWSLLGFAAYTRLLSDAADSPLIVQRGSENQFIIGGFLNYKF